MIGMMTAVRLHSAEDLRLDEVPIPDAGPGEVLVRVHRCGICGTDLHIAKGNFPAPNLPLVLGHEFSGTITTVGDDVTGWAEGDRVAIEPVYKCGRCAPCRAGNYNVCQQIAFHGLMSDGGMAEYTVVPTDMLHRLPDSVPLELGALVEPMSVAYHAATLGDVASGDTAMVFGAGPIGIGLWFALRGKGLDDVFVVEPSATRRAAIEVLGACTLDPTQIDVPAFIAEHTHGDGADAVFDAAGVTPAVATALACVGSRKPMVSVAIYEKPLETPLLNLVMNESRIQGSLCYTGADFEAVIALMAQGAYDTTGWVTRIPIEDVIDEGFEALHAGTKMKVLVDPTI